MNKLRQHVEAITRKGDLQPEILSSDQAAELIHELQVHQIELEIQNEELRQAQESLTVSRDRFSVLFNHAPVGYLVLNDSGMIQETNKTFCNMVGLDADHVKGRGVHEFIAGSDQNLFLARYRSFFKHPDDKTLEMGLVSGSGNLAFVQMSGTRLTLADFAGSRNQSSQLLMTVSDITDRKRAEEELRLSDARLKSLVEILQHRVETTQAFLDFALDEAIKLTQSRFGYIYFYREDRQEFILNTWSKEVMQACTIASPQTRYELDKTGVWGEAVRQRKPVILNDYVAPNPLKKGYPEGHAPLNRFLTVPVFSSGKIVAVIGVANKETDYGETDILQLTLLMDGVWKVVEHREAEAALRDREEQYRSLAENSQDYIMRYDRQHRHIYANSAAIRVSGKAREEYIGHTHREMGFPEYLCTLWESNIDRVFSTGQPHEENFEWMGTDGPIYLNWRLFPEMDAQGQVHSVLGVSRDITGIKRSEENLRKRESLLERIFDVLPIGLWFTDKDGKLLRGNPAGIKIWGAEPQVSPADYGIFKARRLPSGEEIAADDWALAHTIRKGVTIVDELLEIDAFDGQKKIVLNSTSPVLDQDGRVDGAIVVNQDITGRFRAEEEREKLQTQLVQVQKLESVGRLAGGVAHDFNNRLQAILGYTEMVLEDAGPDSPLRKSLLEIQKAAQGSADLTRQLLAFARKQTVSPKILDLNETISSMLKMLHRLIGEDIDFSWKPALNLRPVKIDPSQLDQILVNLCVNARDAISGVGSLTIETENAALDHSYCEIHMGFIPGDYVMLAISDTGTGMEKDIVEQIFEPFFTTKEQGKGTGLGLSTVYGIVKQNNGFINVYSEPGQGTTFRIYLPVTNDQPETVTDASRQKPMHGTETVLLVEDDETILDIGRMVLERFGYTVLATHNPNEALKLVKNHQGPVHLLITDVIMPEMNGQELRNRLHDIQPEIQTLFMSGYTANVIAHHGVLDQGINFLQKPFSVKTLVEKVREVLDGCRSLA
ncbi:MAG: PAS domain S-box protein [Desulfatirhabdiaceae bacterium]